MGCWSSHWPADVTRGSDAHRATRNVQYTIVEVSTTGCCQQVAVSRGGTGAVARVLAQQCRLPMESGERARERARERGACICTHPNERNSVAFVQIVNPGALVLHGWAETDGAIPDLLLRVQVERVVAVFLDCERIPDGVSGDTTPPACCGWEHVSNTSQASQAVGRQRARESGRARQMQMQRQRQRQRQRQYTTIHYNTNRGRRLGLLCDDVIVECTSA